MLLLKLFFSIIWFEGALSNEDCSVKIPFYVDSDCEAKVKHYLHVDIAVYIDVLYMVPMEDDCWQCAIKENKDCGDVMDWSLNGQCYSFTSSQCAFQCTKTQDRLRRLVEQAPIFPPPPRIPETLTTTMRQRFRSKSHSKSCISKNENDNFSLKICDDNKYAQQFTLYPIKGEYLILHTPMKNQSSCESKRNSDYWECSVPGCMITQCDANGLFIPRQCHLSVGYTGTCWCVDINGKEIGGTKTNPGEEPPKCESFIIDTVNHHHEEEEEGEGTDTPKEKGKGKGKSRGNQGRKKGRKNNPGRRILADSTRSLLQAKKKKKNRKNQPNHNQNNKHNKDTANKKKTGEDIDTGSGKNQMIVQRDESAGLCGFGMTQHKEWNKNIIKCHASKETCIVYEKVNQEFGGTCREFCEGFDLECKSGWADLSDYQCEKGEEFGCDDRDGYTSDHICECGIPDCGCDVCEPVEQIVRQQNCIEEVEIPEFYNVPMPDWTIALISEKCQRCVAGMDILCKRDPWVPSGNTCVHHAVTSCKESCSDGDEPDFPTDTFQQTNENLCISQSGTMDVCGPENRVTISRLNSGSIRIHNNKKQCLTASDENIEFATCHKKNHVSQEWFLEVVL